MREAEREMLVKHILEPSMRQNLGIALDTVTVLQDVQTAILANGARNLIAQSMASDPTGRLRCSEENLTIDPLSPYAYLFFRREGWRDGYQVGFESRTGGMGQVILGIDAKGAPLDDRLVENLRAARGGRSTAHYPWLVDLARPFDRWTSKDALVAFHAANPDTTLEPLVSLIATVTTIVDPYFTD